MFGIMGIGVVLRPIPHLVDDTKSDLASDARLRPLARRGSCGDGETTPAACSKRRPLHWTSWSGCRNLNPGPLDPRYLAVQTAWAGLRKSS